MRGCAVEPTAMSITMVIRGGYLKTVSSDKGFGGIPLLLLMRGLISPIQHHGVASMGFLIKLSALIKVARLTT